MLAVEKLVHQQQVVRDLNPRAIDALTMMFFGATYGTSRDFIGKLVDLDEYLAAVDRRLAAGDLHESVRLALDKAKHPMFG